MTHNETNVKNATTELDTTSSPLPLVEADSLDSPSQDPKQFSRGFPWGSLVTGGIFLIILVSPLGQLINHHSTAIFESLLSKDTEVEEKPSMEILPVSVKQIKVVEKYQVKHLYTGTVVSRRQTDLGFERTGKLVEVWVDEGEKVRKDQPLALLDSRGLKAEREQVIAQKDTATAVLKELQAGPRVELIDAARLETKRLESQLKLAKQRHQRRVQLLSEGAITREQLDAALSEYETAQASYQRAKRQLDELLAGSRPEQIEAQQARIRQLEASLVSIEVELEKSTLKAPFSGRISQRLLDEGSVFSTLTAGQPILRIVEDEALEVHVGVPARKAADLVKGSSHQLQIEGKQYLGTVINTIPNLDQKTRSQTVIFSLNVPASANIVIGQVARLIATDTVPTSGYWLPIDAITENIDELWSCYILGQKIEGKSGSIYEVEQKSVEVLYTDGQRVFARGTLQEGDWLITSGSHRLIPGQMVRPINQQLSQ